MGGQVSHRMVVKRVERCSSVLVLRQQMKAPQFTLKTKSLSTDLLKRGISLKGEALVSYEWTILDFEFCFQTSYSCFNLFELWWIRLKRA